MIYLFAGDDVKNKRQAYDDFIQSIPKGTEIFSVSRNDFDPMQIESFYSGAGLFFAKSVVIFKNIFDNEETRDFILEKLALMNESNNSFVFLESKLNKPILNAFKQTDAKGNQINVFELSKEKKEKYDNFLLANALGDRDKRNLWIYFRQAMDKGVGMEELIGVLFWKAKDMILKKKFGKFKESELKNFASKISYLLPEARKEGRDDETAFEQFLLEAF
jgi:hypothetical protein